MNDLTPQTPAPLPPPLPLASDAARPPLGHHPEEREPLTNAVAAIDAILRQPRRVLYQLRQPASGRLLACMLFVALACGLLYGLVVGTFSMSTQLWAAPVKLAGGLLASALICLPSLYIFMCLSGSQARLREVCGLVAGLLMLMSILLVGFAPVAWLFSQSTESVTWMGGLHLVFWLIATGFGLRFLVAGFSHSKARSNTGLATWVVIFVLVALQMSTALRPLVGRADSFWPMEKKFFLSHWEDCLNAAQRSPAPK